MTKRYSFSRAAGVLCVLAAIAGDRPAMAQETSTVPQGATSAQQGVPSALQFGAKLLGTPCRVVNATGAKLLQRVPGTNQPVLAINSATPGESGAAVFIDYRNGKSTVLPMPVGTGGWATIEVAPGKLLFESLGPLSLVTVDTTGGEYKVESVAPVPDNQYAWQFAKANDGKIYFGSYPNCHLYSYDPVTKKVVDLGKIGPEENLYLRFVTFDAASGQLICATGMSKSQMIAYDIATGKQTVVADAYPSAMQSAIGSVFAVLPSGLHRFDAAQMKMVPLTNPAPPAGTQWKGIGKATSTDKLLLSTDKGDWYQITAEGKAIPVWQGDLRGGSLVDIEDETGQVVGLRGQDYFVAKPLAGEIEWRPLTEQPMPVSMHFITGDPRGGVTGGPTFGQTLFRFDPARKLEQNTGQVADGGGEVYDGLWKDGKFYYVAYSGGYFGVWDPEQPWDQWHNKNPRIIEQYNKPESGSLIRPIGGIEEGPGGRFYTGWSAAYGKAGGGLTEYDPATGKSRAWTNDRFAEAMSIGTIATDDKYVYGTTSNLFSGIKPPAKPIIFWVFDPQTEQVVFKKTINGRPFKVPGTGHIWLATGQGLLQFKREKMDFEPPIAWPRGVGSVKSVGSSTARGANAWIALDNDIVKLQDGERPQLSVLFQTTKPPHLAAGYDGQLYYTQGAQLWSVPQ